MSLYVFSILLFPMVRRAYVLRGGTYEDKDIGCSRGWPHVSHGISLCWSRGDDGRAYGREGQTSSKRTNQRNRRSPLCDDHRVRQ